MKYKLHFKMIYMYVFRSKGITIFLSVTFKTADVFHWAC